MEKSTKAIRKELAILIKQKLKVCTSKKEENVAVETARQEINLKYGKGWREWDNFKPSNQKYSEPSIYDGHTFGEYWMD
jgi:hypothetical protein